MHSLCLISRRPSRAMALLAALALVAGPTFAIAPPTGPSAVAAQAFYHPDIYISSAYQPASEVSGLLSAGLTAALAALGASPAEGFIDVRTGSWGTLLLAQPMIPGSGVGNTLTWSNTPASKVDLEDAAWQAFAGYLAANQAALGFEPTALGSRSVTAHGDGELVQITVGQQAGDLPVRGASLKATISHGNLVLMGARNWAAVSVPLSPSLSEAAAVGAAEGYLGRSFNAYWSEPHLEVLPMAADQSPFALGIGSGLDHRLVWAMGPAFADDRGSWEVLVDAHSGEVLSFRDKNEYVKNVRGGVFPVSNDGIGIEGIEHPDYPMPFADILDDGGNLFFTDSGGDLVCAGEGSSIRTSLSGRYVSINDECGPISEIAADPADIDLGLGPGTDCQVPPGHSPGDTHASRTGFYEVNRIVEIARSWLPDNPWLNAPLTSNMNIDENCNAFWSGGAGTINFYTSGGGCRNTGEIAAVFDHEWGHGMDNNDASPFVSAPGEAYADVASLLRLNDSCVARGFDAADDNCGGNGDACLSCSGVREADWMKRASGVPHNLDWNQQDPLDPNGIRGGCRINGVGSTSFGPCGNGTHCEGSMASEAIWDLLKRDLPCSGIGWQNVAGPVGGGQCAGGASPAIDSDTARERMHRYFYLGGGQVGNWYNCNPVGPAGSYGDGCNADGTYLNFLAIDDDNGDLTDGTPHMEAIYDAFDRHQIACDTPAPVDAGCLGTLAAPTVTYTPGHKSVNLSWDPVAGAEEYWVFRSDGIQGCDFGKARVGTTAGDQFLASGLRNGREYYFGVVAVGASDSCQSLMSACTAVTPGAGGASLKFGAAAPELVGLSGGDGDPFIDNCETGTVGFSVDNDGEVALTNVRVAAVEPLSHPSISIVSTPTFAASLASCASADGTFQFQADGVSFNDTIRFRIDVTADELGGGVVSGIAEFVAAESDFAPVASRTWSFDNDREDWSLIGGIFDHDAGPGGNLTTGFLRSSSFQDDQCDQIASPIIRLTDSSTLSLYNQFTIEAGDPNLLGFYDRANVGIFDLATGERTTVVPDGGRLYNASGPAGACVTQGEQGWSSLGPAFLESTWSAAALNPGGSLTGKVATLQVAYGTDPLFSLDGFQFDEVTLTNYEAQTPDTQSDVCEVNNDPVAVDDSETTDKNMAVSIDVLANDSDPDGDPLTVSGTSDPANGSVVIEANNTVTYTPDAGFVGTDTFTYTVSDGRGGSATATVTVTVEDDGGGGSNGRVHGSGWLYTVDVGSHPQKLNFSIDARAEADGSFKGKLKINDKEAGVKIDSKQITGLSAGTGTCNGAATGANAFAFTAAGTFNGASATFRACGEDHGDPGKGNASHPPDRLYVECVSGCSYNTASRTPDDGIDGGNIHLHTAIGGNNATGGGQGLALKSAGGAKVLDLDPILLTQAPAGTPQVLVATAHTADGLALDGRAVVLTWTRSDGSTGSQTALTDALGVAVFTVLVESGEVEYVATDGALESNAIGITGSTL